MKKLLFFLFIISQVCFCNNVVDSLKHEFKKTKIEEKRIDILDKLIIYLNFTNPDSCIHYCKLGLSEPSINNKLHLKAKLYESIALAKYNNNENSSYLKEYIDSIKKVIKLCKRNDLLRKVNTSYYSLLDKYYESKGFFDSSLYAIKQLELYLEKDWEIFYQKFNESHANFLQKLIQKHPDLTTYEQKLCSLIKMDLSNQEIANILHIENNSVRMAKTRLKKKLNIEEDLKAYLY